MPYATRNDLELSFGTLEVQQLSDRMVPALGATNDAVLDAVLENASGMMNGYIVGRYPLPITDVNALAALKPQCCAIARYMLMSNAADQQAKDMFTQAIAYLTNVGKGAIDLIAPADVPQPPGIGLVEFVTGDKVFGRSSDTSYRDC